MWSHGEPIDPSPSIDQAVKSGRMRPVSASSNKRLRACNVSRVPLREGMPIVASDGLLNLAPHRGRGRTLLSESEFGELFDLGMALEGFAATVAHLRPTLDLSSLHAMNDKMEAFIRSQDYDSYHATAVMFHAALVVAAGNRLLIETCNRITVRFRRYQAALSKIPEMPPQSMAEDNGILDAM